MIYHRECVVCRVQFDTSSRKRTTCSDECKKILIRRNALKQDHSKRIKTYDFVCEICGKKFSVCGSKGHGEMLKTCSDACFKKTLSEHAKGQDPSPMREGYRKSPIRQPDERNASAREWAIVSPDGEVFRFRNMSHFVRTHKELFEGYLQEKRKTPYAAFALSNLAPWRNRKEKSWHGWTWAGDSPTE